MQNSGQTTVVLFGNALDPRGRTNHPQPASPRPHGKPVAPVLAKNQPVWRSRPSKTLVTGRTPLSSPHRTLAAQALTLCGTLDQTATIFPGSRLRVRFSVRPPPRIGLAFPGSPVERSTAM